MEPVKLLNLYVELEPGLEGPVHETIPSIVSQPLNDPGATYR